MGGGTILQLVANENNIPDLYLTGDPQITHFKILFRRATPFSMLDSVINIPNNMRFGDTAYVPIRPFADMLHTLSLVVDIPTPEVVFKDPTYRTVRDILIPCGLERTIDLIALANGDTLDDPVTYEKLFGPDITNPTGPLVVSIEDTIEETDIKYSKRLEVLDKFKTEYTTTDNRFAGRYVAIKPELIDFEQFAGTADDPLGESEKPINPSGYLIMKADRTQALYDEFISAPGNDFDINCSDFMYDGRTREEYLNGESVYETGLQPPAIPVMEDLIRIYPRQIPEYRPIRTVMDFTTFLAEPKNHSIIISIAQIDVRRKVKLEDLRIENRQDPDDLIKLDNVNEFEVDECIFGDITVSQLIDCNYEFGVYSFESDFDPNDFDPIPRSLDVVRSIPDYDTCLADLIRRSKIRVPAVSIDRDVTIEVTHKFNRYCSNENAIYNKTYDLRPPLRVPETLEDVNGEPYLVDEVGYWLLDVSLIDRLEQSNPDIVVGEGEIDDLAFESQDVIMLTEVEDDTDILVNPFYLDARSDRLDWATYVIDRQWKDEVLKREVVNSETGVVIPDDDVDPEDPTHVTIFTKPENIRDGVDILSDMILEMYEIEDVELASDIARMLNNDLFNVEDIEAYHAFLEAIRKDLLNTENQISDYRLNSASGCDGSNLFNEYDPDASHKQTLFNSRDIQEIMIGKLLRDIIYIDQHRFGKNFPLGFVLYKRKTDTPVGFDDFIINRDWVQNSTIFNGAPPQYYEILSGAINLTNRQKAHHLVKYIMWSYYVEHLDVQSRASTTVEQNLPAITEEVSLIPYDFYDSIVRYFNLYAPNNTEQQYYVWFDTNGDGVTNDPLLPGISIPVDISALIDPNDTGAVALALQTAIDTNGNFGATVASNLVTITPTAQGDTMDITDNNTAYDFSVTQQGTEFAPEISTVDTTTNVVLPPDYYTSAVRVFDLYFFNPDRYYVWFDTDGDGTTNDPGSPVPGAMPIPVDISGIKLPDDRAIAEAIQIAVDAEADFCASICENRVLITNTADGGTTDLTDFNTGFNFYVDEQGATTNPEISSVDTTRELTPISHSVIDYLSKMMIQNTNVPENPPSNPVPYIEYLKNMRYGKDDINEITDSCVYDDNSLIERFRTDIEVRPQDGYFERQQLLSGIRFNADDTINDQIEDLRDLVGNEVQNPLFVDGRGTAINREVELYHVIRTIDHHSSANISRLLDSTIKQYFIDVIAESYKQARALERNYTNTISYSVVIKYLDEFFSNTMVLNSELSVQEIADVLVEIIQNTVIRTLNNYNQYLFYIWQNSSYVDEELEPCVTDVNVEDIGFLRKQTFEVDYCQPGDDIFLDNCYPERIAEDPTFNPTLLRAKFWAGIDQKYRPRMGYGFTSDINFMDPTTYRTEKSTVLEEREFTADQAGDTSRISTPSVLGLSDFKDQYSEYIDNQVNRVKNQMKDLINFGPSNQTELVVADTLRENLVYTDWFDLQQIQTKAVERLAIDRGLFEYEDCTMPDSDEISICEEDLSYYNEAYVVNHLPMTLSYYYGLYAQQIYASIYPALATGETNLIETLDYTLVSAATALSEDASINPLSSTGTVDPNSVLQYMSTDVRENPQCPLHSYISNLTTVQTDLYDRYLRDNATLGDTADPIYDECPLCFRTYSMFKLFDELTATVFTSDSQIQKDGNRTLENEITDDEYIQNIINGTPDDINRDGRFKNIFLYRPEVVYYDRVTETYYDTAIQYFLVRYATIQYRYARMVRHISELSNPDYITFITGIDPSVSPGAMMIFNQLNTITFTNGSMTGYKDHLDQLRLGGDGITFEDEIDLFNKAVMHDPSDDLINALKNNVRAIESTTEPIDYTKGEETIYPYLPERVIQNIVYNPSSTITESYFSVRHLMYRGNISVWYTIQRTIIDLYNDYLNNVSDPREIETMDDLFLETYNILQDRVPDQYTMLSPSNRRLIDFYRFKQTREEGQITELPIELVDGTSFVINDLAGEAIDMMNYSRELMIYYKMLITRYEKMRFLLDIKNNPLDDNTYYFEKTDAIVKGYLDPIKQKIEEFEKAELVLGEEEDRECFYFGETETDPPNRHIADSSNLYYIDAEQFRETKIRLFRPEFVDDYVQFNYLNNFHLSQAFTYNQVRNLYRMLGMAELDELNTSGSTDADIRVPEAYRDLDLVYTDDFERYRSLKQLFGDVALDNTSIYTEQELVNDTLNYEHRSNLVEVTNRGLFYDMWANFPTISTVLYDLDFDPVTFNETDPMAAPGVIDRYYTGINLSSPLNILKNRLEQFDFDDPACGVFHTPELKDWEAKYICSKADAFDALRRVFNVYYFLTGACDYQDIYSVIGFARLEIAIGSKSLTARFSEFEAIAADVVKSLAPGFSITNDQLRIQHQLTTLLLLRNRHEPTVNNIKLTHIESFSCIRERIDLVADQFDFYTRELSEAEITIIMDDIYDQLDEIDSIIAAITIDDLLSGIEVGIIDGSISDLETLVALVDSNLDATEMAVNMAIAELNAKLLIIQEYSCLKFTFIRSSESSLITDARVHTPIRLFNVKELQLMNNFRHVEDVIRFLISGVVALMTPTTDRITPIYLDGIVTDAESVIIEAEEIKKEYNSRYDLPSIFDGGFNPLLADIIGDANPFRAGNYFSTSLCEAMNTLFPQTGDINSETITYQNMIDDLIRSIQGNLDIMDKLTVLERYVDLTKAPVCGFFYYDFDRFILLDNVRSIGDLKTYTEHKKDVRTHVIKKKRQKKSALVNKDIKSRSIYDIPPDDGTLIDARKRYKQKKLTETNRTVRQLVEDDMDDGGMGVPIFFGSDVYEKILKVLRITDTVPEHAWVRQLGFRMIEDLALVIDGEEIDEYNSELMLLLRKTMVDPEHDRGMNIMVGHVPEMYEISNKPRPAMRLYINTWFAFSRFAGCSLPLVNMIYSKACLRIKLRDIEQLLYIEPCGQLKKPVKIHTNFMGRYIFLEEEERKRLATSRTQTIMERYRAVSTIKTLSDIKSSNVADGGKGRAMSNTTSGHTGNVTGSSSRVERLIKQRYYFEDPTKFLMWRMRLIYPNPRPEDIIYWDIAAGSEGENMRLGLMDERGDLLKKIKIFDRAKMQMNSVTRDNWRQEEYYRLLTTYNRSLRALDLNEAIYSFAMYLKGLGPQPSGAANLTLIDNLTMYYDMSEDLIRALEAGARLKIDMFQCSHNVFVAMSGFGALQFYGTHYS
jgi:Major capsid protein N-terminus